MPSFRGVVRISHPTLGGTGTNTWHVRVLSPEDPLTGDLESATSIIEDFYFGVDGVYPSGTNINFDGVWTEILAEDPEVRQGTTFNQDSSGSSDPLPPATAICVGWRANTGGRRGRGRTFLGPVAASALQSDGTIDPGVLGAVRTAAEGLVDASEGFGNGAIGIYSPSGPMIRDITSTATRDIFAVLRSRRD